MLVLHNKHRMVFLAFYCYDWEAVNFGSLQLHFGLTLTFCLVLLVAQKYLIFLCQKYCFLLFFLNKRPVEIFINFCERNCVELFLQDREGNGPEAKGLGHSVLSVLLDTKYLSLCWCLSLSCCCNGESSHLQIKIAL